MAGGLRTWGSGRAFPKQDMTHDEGDDRLRKNTFPQGESLHKQSKINGNPGKRICSTYYEGLICLMLKTAQEKNGQDIQTVHSKGKQTALNYTKRQSTFTYKEKNKSKLHQETIFLTDWQRRSLRLSGQANGVRFPRPPSLGVEQRAILQNPVKPHFRFQERLLLTLAERQAGEAVSFQCVRLLPARSVVPPLCPGEKGWVDSGRTGTQRSLQPLLNKLLNAWTRPHK